MELLKFTTIKEAQNLTGINYLGKANNSSKLIKNMKIGVYTYALYLSPANVSGYNVCSHSTPECRLGCLATSGLAKVEIYSNKTYISNARMLKTKLFHEHPEFFMEWLIKEITNAKNYAENKNLIFSVRLNCTSDIDWANVRMNGKNIFELFPTVQFYDYTKNFRKFDNKPVNYHLTYSYTGRNWFNCESLLKKGYNVAMIFNVKDESQLPLQYKGYNVVNGDENDYRVNNTVESGHGVIVGLKWKEIADREVNNKIKHSCFVIQSNDVNCNYVNQNIDELVLS